VKKRVSGVGRQRQSKNLPEGTFGDVMVPASMLMLIARLALSLN
jgi:hypothetical protein